MITKKKIQQNIKTVIKPNNPTKITYSKMVTRTKKRNDNQSTSKKTMKKSFDVSLSEESKRQAERLDELRRGHNEEYAGEKKKHDAEFEKLSTRERARVENYQKKQEENLNKLHARYQAAGRIGEGNADHRADRDAGGGFDGRVAAAGRVHLERADA